MPMNETRRPSSKKLPLPQLSKPPSIHLSPLEETILREAHRGYQDIIIEKEFGGGYSGARVFLVLPVKPDNTRGARLVTKIGPAKTMRHEQDNYKNIIECSLPLSAAQVRNYFEKEGQAALDYVFIGQGMSAQAANLEDYCRTKPTHVVVRALESLLKSELVPTWYKQSKPLNRPFRDEYGRHLPPYEDLEQITETVFPNLSLLPGDQVEIPGVPGSYPHPLKKYPEIANLTLEGRSSCVHGDLHPRNVLVDQTDRAWLIDFAKITERHNLFDFIKLETYLRLMVLAGQQAAFSHAEYARFEQALLDPASKPPGNESLRAAYQIILSIRESARDCMNTPGNFRAEYLPGLFLYCLAMMKYYPTNGPAPTQLMFLTTCVLGRFLLKPKGDSGSGPKNPKRITAIAAILTVSILLLALWQGCENRQKPTLTLSTSGMVTHSPPPTLTATTHPTPTLTASRIPTITTLPHLSRGEIDEIFGQNNWFCFPDRENGIGVRKLQFEYKVEDPISYVETRSKYTTGQTAPISTGATVGLALPLPQNECPGDQTDQLHAWQDASLADREALDSMQLDTLLANSPWECILGYPSAIRVTGTSTAVKLAYPFIAADEEDHTKYGVGDELPPGKNATFWLAKPIALDQCRYQTLVLDPMESIETWMPQVYADGSSINITPTIGVAGSAMQIAYRFTSPTAWALITRSIEPAEWKNLLGIAFHHKGTGNANTLEIKLIDSDGMTFGFQWRAATNTRDQWVEKQLSLEQFTCWWSDKAPPNNTCPTGAKLDLTKVIRLDFAISAKPGDEVGEGIVWLDDLIGIRANADMPISFQDFEEFNSTDPLPYSWDTSFGEDNMPCIWEYENVKAGKRSLHCTAQAEANGSEKGGGTVGINPASEGQTLDLSQAQTLSIWVYNLHGEDTVQLRLRDQSDYLSSEGENSWSKMATVKDQWTQITWFLEDIRQMDPSIDWAHIKNIEIYLWNDGVYYFDDVWITDKLNHTP